MLIYTDVLYTVVITFFLFKWNTHWNVDWYLVLLPKSIKVMFFDGRVEIIYRPQWEHNELPESIRAYDKLDEGLIISYVFV